MPKVDRFASLVAHRIEDGIISQGWPVGDVLGTEAELMGRYDVSRGVLREAIRLLEHKQVAKMRPGPNGGLVVGAPASSAVAETISNYFALSDITLDEVVTARRHIESDCLRLAAERMTERAIGRLRRAADDADSDQFHQAIGEHSRNPALSIVVHGLVRASGHVAPTRPKPVDVARRHRDLIEQLLVGDLVGAQQLLEHDLDQLAERGRHGDHHADRIENERRKLPEQLAYRIVRDLRAAGHGSGDVIGSEHDFVRRYEISRSVFRQTVRILEYYDMLEMRQGAGGGVVVGAGDPLHVVEAAVTYLDFIAIASTDLSEARRVLELAALTEMMSGPGPVDCSLLSDEFEESLDVDRTIVYRRGPDFHLLLTQLSGNRPMHFFAMVLARLQTSRILPGQVSVDGPPRSDAERQQIGASIVAAHGRLVEAIEAGDLGLARHRLSKHLAAMTERLADRRVIIDA